MAREGSGGRTDEVIAVDTGAQYVKALKDGFQPHLGVDLFLSGGFTLANCVAQLQEAKASPKSYLSDFRLDRVSLRKLPAELSPMVSGEQFEAAEGKNGWADPSAKVKKADRERLVIHGDDGQVTLWIAGWGDFDEDGVEDILLGAYYDFSPGSLSYGTTVLITKVTVNGPLRPVRKRPKK